VAITHVNGKYPQIPPFHPSIRYPEYKGEVLANDPNYVYDSVRKSLALLKLDLDNYRTSEWNPLKKIISPGDTVFIKPNLVTHEYRKSCSDKHTIFSIITHPSVIRPIADYVDIALKGKGQILIGDNSHVDADFPRILEKTNLNSLTELYEVECNILDLRFLWCSDLQHYGYKSKMTKLKGDPQGDSIINIGKDSLFNGINPLLLRGTFTDRNETIKHHNRSKHEYSISNSILNSDVYISIPKLKAHRKVGATLNIKGLVGIVYNKNTLPHWRIGYPKFGGDEYPSPSRTYDYCALYLRHFINDVLPEKWYLSIKEKVSKTFLKEMFQTDRSPSGVKHRGAWRENDTAWRMVVDLYNIFINNIGESKTRKYFSVIDGIVSGEGDGPFCPTPKETNVIISGEDLFECDMVGVRLMDFDVNQIKYLNYINNSRKQNITIVSDIFPPKDFFSGEKRYFNFKPPKQWNELSLDTN
jgi:uncharacterized protein (DUF362 family)